MYFPGQCGVNNTIRNIVIQYQMVNIVHHTIDDILVRWKALDPIVSIKVKTAQPAEPNFNTWELQVYSRSSLLEKQWHMIT